VLASMGSRATVWGGRALGARYPLFARFPSSLTYELRYVRFRRRVSCAKTRRLHGTKSIARSDFFPSFFGSAEQLDQRGINRSFGNLNSYVKSCDIGGRGDLAGIGDENSIDEERRSKWN